MTNQELMQEIKDLRKEQSEQHKEMQKELKDLKKEFYLFKGKAASLITIFSAAVGFIIDYLKHK